MGWRPVAEAGEASLGIGVAEAAGGGVRDRDDGWWQRHATRGGTRDGGSSAGDGDARFDPLSSAVGNGGSGGGGEGREVADPVAAVSFARLSCRCHYHPPLPLRVLRCGGRGGGSCATVRCGGGEVNGELHDLSTAATTDPVLLRRATVRRGERERTSATSRAGVLRSPPHRAAGC
uniref:Uncharacterized protein n=1 Tax=Oryza meridionalis TaxID=40149 RepID=A0A0E0CS37_9ORYZ